jgi:gliding motility-associated-like protein
VTVTSYCNEQFTDAIQLLPPATVNFDLGPGVTICPGDTTTIIPPAGYSGYSWFPDYNELTAALPSLSVYPYQDTTYTCTALTTQGCRVADSIRVQLAKVQPIDLGGAVSICPDGQDTLDAGGGFISYLWSTGETTRQITVNQPAQYSVEATNPNNSCISRASVTVSWHNVLKPDLGPDISLCTDSSHLFNAGKGYMTYLWQDGSTNATLIATQPGEYWVQVVDSNGCSAGDTVEVIGKAYCLIGIHFPNAFTPNGDGKNDTFKAILSGSLDTYHLAIFDRYGEIVFETNDPGKGWDGRYKNISRPAGTFVWYATYHFSGSSEPATMQKGTLELIR